MSTIIQQYFYRNGELRLHAPLKNGRRHGRARTWHNNGTLATEEPYLDDLAHGVFRQWDEKGRLLGQFRMVHGTGVMRVWYDNGQLQMEFSLVRGESCGRDRHWLRDGTLTADKLFLHNRVVTLEEYRVAVAKDKTLPKFRGTLAKVHPRNSAAEEKRTLRLFTQWLLQKPHCAEARAWFKRKASDKTTRSLGRFKRESDAMQFVGALYKAGATKVIAPDIYFNKAGDQFADCLLVQLPKNSARRKTIRKACAILRSRRLGAMQPDDDFGETHLYLSMA